MQAHDINILRAGIWAHQFKYCIKTTEKQNNDDAFIVIEYHSLDLDKRMAIYIIKQNNNYMSSISYKFI